MAGDFDSVDLLGVQVSLPTMGQAVAELERWIQTRECHYMCASATHPIALASRDASFRQVLNRAGMVVPDGMPVVWAARRLGKQASRIYGPDLMLSFFEHAASRGYAHYLYGGAPEVPELLAKEMCARYPGTVIAGTYSPPFRPLSESEDREVVEMINESEADILWVGLGAPKQEIWMREHWDRIRAPAMVGVGAAFDFHVGRIRQAPRWMQHTGLEWVFRLTQDPQRLWRRYLVYNTLFLYGLGAQLLRRRSRQ